MHVKFHKYAIGNGTGNITDKNSKVWTLEYDLNVYALTILIAEDGSMCSFEPWPSYPEYWRATGLKVVTERVGLASAFYHCASQLIQLVDGRYIAPSDNLMPEGKAMWEQFDPLIAWEPVPATGGFRPNLTGISPP